MMGNLPNILLCYSDKKSYSSNSGRHRKLLQKDILLPFFINEVISDLLADIVFFCEYCISFMHNNDRILKIFSPFNIYNMHNFSIIFT